MSTQLSTLKLMIIEELDDVTDDIETLTINLRQDLLELDIESVDIERDNEKPKESKTGEPFTWMTLLLTLIASGGVLTTLINAIQSWLTRNERRSIILEINGDKLEIQGVRSKDQRRLTDAWINRQKEK
jgi:hypothetical protein